MSYSDKKANESETEKRLREVRAQLRRQQIHLVVHNIGLTGAAK